MPVIDDTDLKMLREQLEHAEGEADRLTADNERLRVWMECIERTTDEEIKARFQHHSKTEEQMAGKSVIYTMLSIPRNMARRALAGDAIEQKG